MPIGHAQSVNLLVADGRVVERDTDSTTVMSVVLPDDALATKLPQPCVVVRAAGNEVGAIG